jgi:carboxymethylenebutenolidase
MMENFLSAETQDGPMAVFVCSESGAAKRPVMIVLQEAFGVNQHIKEVCRRFAGEGFLVVAPELFHRSGKHIEVPYGDRKAFMPLLSKLTNEKMVTDLEATQEFLKSLPNADQTKVFAVGFCIGGFAAVLAAMCLKLKGAMSFYGAGQVREREGMGPKPLVSNYNEIRCPVQYFFGEDDASIPKTDRDALEEALKKNHKAHKFHVYAKSDHGFFCNERASYNPESSKEAWREMMLFVRANGVEL